jgi:hypothetical protein
MSIPAQNTFSPPVITTAAISLSEKLRIQGIPSLRAVERDGSHPLLFVILGAG